MLMQQDRVGFAGGANPSAAGRIIDLSTPGTAVDVLWSIRLGIEELRDTGHFRDGRSSIERTGGTVLWTSVRLFPSRRGDDASVLGLKVAEIRLRGMGWARLRPPRRARQSSDLDWNGSDCLSESRH
jgi:hypothetical protein